MFMLFIIVDLIQIHSKPNLYTHTHTYPVTEHSKIIGISTSILLLLLPFLLLFLLPFTIHSEQRCILLSSILFCFSSPKILSHWSLYLSNSTLHTPLLWIKMLWVLFGFRFSKIYLDLHCALCTWVTFIGFFFLYIFHRSWPFSNANCGKF